MVTLADLKTVPNLPAKFTLSLNSPVAPAGMVQGTGGIWAVVQPHEGWILRTVTCFPEMLVKEKEKWAKSAPLRTSVLFINESQARMPFGKGWPERETSGTKTGLEATVGGGELGGSTRVLAPAGGGMRVGGGVGGGAGGAGF